MVEPKELILGVEQKIYPQFLYKYRKDNCNTKKIITKNELWFSNPNKFNDPYDCNTPIDKSNNINTIKNWLKSIGIDNHKLDKLAEKLEKNPNLIEEETKKALSNLGVCCFSTIYDSILQWSHYSDYHKGLCLKFDITKDPDLFFVPIVVSYKKFMRHYNHLLQSNNIVKYLIEPKFSDWSYESEIRIVKTRKLIKKNRNKRAFKYKDDALKEIIFGTKTTEVVKNKYKELCKKNNKTHVQFYQMELSKRAHYKLIKK